VRGLTYANSYGADTPGEGRIPPPELPPLFSVIQGEARYLLPQDPHFSVPEGNQNKFQTMGNVFPSIASPVKIRIPQGILEEEFRRGFGGNLFPKGSPRSRTPSLKTKSGVRRGNSNSPFSSP